MGFPGGAVVKNPPANASGEGNGTPLQYSCLANPMDGGAWWAAIHGVAKSRTRLSDLTSTFMHWRRKWQPTPVFLPGESQGRGSPVGCRLWDRTESDTTEATQQQQQQQKYYTGEWRLVTNKSICLTLMRLTSSTPHHIPPPTHLTT